jgi:hypothetical protein
MLGGNRHLPIASAVRRVLAAPALACLAALYAAAPSIAAHDGKPVPADRTSAAQAQPVPPLPEAKSARAGSSASLTLETFLDRLMIAESGGRDSARNPRSTALGPFQFIRSTFLEVARRHFAEETASLSTGAILALRTDRAFARRAAEAYTKENAAHLASQGLQASFPNLRLAYLAGPHGAARVLSASPDARVSTLLSRGAIAANPFMAGMTAADLLTKCARDLEVSPQSTAGITPDGSRPAAGRAHPKIVVKCNLGLPSCRRWLALQTAKLERKMARAEERPPAPSRRPRK